MIEKEQDAEADSERVRNLQDREAIGGPAGHLRIYLLKQVCGAYVCVKGHDGEGPPKKADQTDQEDFSKSKNGVFAGGLLIGKDEVRLADGENQQGWFGCLYFIYNIGDRKHIAAVFSGSQAEDREHTETIPERGAGTVQSGDILKLDSRVGDLDVAVDLKVEYIGHLRLLFMDRGCSVKRSALGGCQDFILGLKMRLAR